jgi:DNA-binding transcriptional MerR regulator
VPEYLSADEIAAILRAEGDESISARTVHYYAEQKLLPSPEYDGTRPRYTAVHLDAMREARRRKREGQRLREIAPLANRISSTPLPAQAPAAMVPPAAPPRPPARPGATAIVRAPGLTLAAEGWSDDVLHRIVRAVQNVIKEREQAREGGDS